MPYTKKKSAARKGAKRTIVKVPGLSMGFPDTYRCKLKYVDTYDMNTSGSGGNYKQFQWHLNSLYDPDRTETGHQPTYFDQLTEIYKKYRVKGCWVNCTIFNKNTGLPLLVNFSSSGLGAAVSEDPESTAQSTGTTVKMMSCEGSDNTYNYKRYFAMDKVFGVSKNEIATNALYHGNTGGTGVGSDPSSHAILTMNTAGANATLIGFFVRMELTFVAEFDHKRMLLES